MYLCNVFLTKGFLIGEKATYADSTSFVHIFQLGDLEAVKQLLEDSDVDVNAVGRDGFTPLIFASVVSNS